MLEQGGRSPEIRAFYAFVEAALDLPRLERELAGIARLPVPDDLDVAAHKVWKALNGSPLTAPALRQAFVILIWMLKPGKYLRTSREFGLTPTQALDHAFFHPLRVRFNDPNEEQTILREKINRQNVVVSFP